MWQVSVDFLLQTADYMFPLGKGAPRAMPKVDGAAPLIHTLLFNAKNAVDALWKQRGWDPKKPEKTKAALGYALDQEEAAAYVVTSALHKPLLSPIEARYIGRRINNLAGPCGSITSKLAKLRKRAKAAAPQVAALLQAAAALSFAPPPHQSAASSRAPAPAPPPEPPPAPPPDAAEVQEQLGPKDRLRRRAAAAAMQGCSARALGARLIPDLAALFGSRPAAEAIHEVVEIEVLERALARDRNDPHDTRNYEAVLKDYKAALAKIKKQIPGVVCCDAFESGGCAHGMLCECGWLQAPWPWIPYRLEGPFCDCHMQDRSVWQGAAGYRCWSSEDASELYPDAGPHHGSAIP